MELKEIDYIKKNKQNLPLSLQKIRQFKRLDRCVNYFFIQCKKYNTTKYNTSPFYKVISTHCYE